MDIQQYLQDFKARFDPKLEAYFDARIEDVRAENVLVADALKHAKRITLAGGKRLRPAFMLAGYQAAGGTEEERLIQAALSVEFIHMFLLVHDDIIDRDRLRHGIPTIHDEYCRFGETTLGLADGRHFGNSIALILGDMLFAFGNEVIFRSGFPESRIIAALAKTQQIVSQTAIGEASDIYHEYAQQATSADILKMYEQKTARYTFEGPLHLGAILAGKEAELLDSFTRYALPLGTAFQIQDDLLGVFGDEKRLGKPVGSDIQEGKLTLLVTTVFEKSRAYREELIGILGKGPELSAADIDRFRSIITDSGAVREVKALAERSLHEARQVLEALTLPLAPQTFLSGVTDYMLNRDY